MAGGKAQPPKRMRRKGFFPMAKKTSNASKIISSFLQSVDKHLPRTRDKLKEFIRKLQENSGLLGKIQAIVFEDTAVAAPDAVDETHVQLLISKLKGEKSTLEDTVEQANTKQAETDQKLEQANQEIADLQQQLADEENKVKALAEANDEKLTAIKILAEQRRLIIQGEDNDSKNKVFELGVNESLDIHPDLLTTAADIIEAVGAVVEAT